RGEDPVQPAGDAGQCLGDGLLCEDIGKWQVAVLKELPPQKLHLLLNPRLGRMAHPWASLPVMDVVRNTISQSKGGPFCLCHFDKGACCRTKCHSSVGRPDSLHQRCSCRYFTGVLTG